MELYFLRHGIAEEKHPDSKKDADRELTAEGIKKMQKAAQGMGVLKLSFDAVYSSPYVRARQTAEITVKALGFKNGIQLSDAITPYMNYKDFIKLIRINKIKKSLLFVGHQPSLGQMVSRLLSGREDLPIDFKKGALALVSLDEERGFYDFEGAGILEWLLTSKQLRALA